MGQDNVGVAFALVIGAGAATAIGSAVVFFPSLVKYASKKTLAAGLGLSAGVMTYVSFVEILQKSLVAFMKAGISHDKAYVYMTLCFFTGIFLMVVMNFVVHSLLLGSHQKGVIQHDDHHHQRGDEGSSDDLGISAPVCCSADAGARIERLQQMGEEIEEREHSHRHDHDHSLRHDNERSETTGHHRNCQSGTADDDDSDALDGMDNVENGSHCSKEGHNNHTSLEEKRRLKKMSLNTAIAIGLHNFPEGLATFVAALEDPRVGVVLAIAIAIHNIPEGLCVSLPVYYATGNRWQAFAWGCLSGISEPIAALLGWAVLANSFSNELYGVLFGMVAGMMVIISAKELLPTAHRYDSEDSIVTNAFILGMTIMALSLILFLL